MTALTSYGKPPCRAVRLSLLVLAACAATAIADSVILKSGAELKGEIIAEDAHEVRLAVSRTSSGDIRTVKIISQSLVAEMRRSQPELAIEPDPAPAGSQTDAARTRPSADGVRARIDAADRATAEGQYDEAAAMYRDVITRAENRLAELDEQAGDDTVNDRMEAYEIRDEAYQHLIIALRGKQDRQEEAVEAAERELRELDKIEKRIGDQIDDVKRDISRAAHDDVRRLGTHTSTQIASRQIRDLERDRAAARSRVVAQRQFIQQEKLAIVNLDSEIGIAEESAERAEDEHQEAERARRRR